MGASPGWSIRRATSSGGCVATEKVRGPSKNSRSTAGWLSSQTLRPVSMPFRCREHARQRLEHRRLRETPASNGERQHDESQHGEEISTDGEIRIEQGLGSQRVLQEIDTVAEGVGERDCFQNARQVLDGVQGAAQKEHGKDHEVHDHGKVLQRLAEDRDEGAEAGAHQGLSDEAERAQRRIARDSEIAEREQDQHEQERLAEADQRGTERARQEDDGAREGGDDEHAHDPRFLVVDHRQRSEQGAEEHDHGHEPRHQETLVAPPAQALEHALESGADHEQPDQRSHHAADEPPPLAQHALEVASHDGGDRPPHEAPAAIPGWPSGW